MDSPYLSNLEQRQGSATSSVEAALAALEIGIYRARFGDFTAAERIANAVRAQFSDGSSGRVTVMLNLLEGLVPFFRDLASTSRDRLQRAHVLSVAGRDRRLSALVSAWLAHVDFSLHRHAEMARSVRTCVETIDASDTDTICRLALTLGDAFCVAGLEGESRAWYGAARNAAVKLGDHATIAAMTGNSSSLRVFVARLSAITASPSADHVNLIHGEAKTALNYQSVAGLSSFDELLRSTYASVLVLRGDYRAAIAELERLNLGEIRTSMASQPVVLLSDVALCLASVGRNAEAEQAIERFDVRRLEESTDDDVALACHSFAVACRALGRTDQASSFELMREGALAKHRQEMQRLGDLLAPYRSTTVLPNA